MVADGSRRDAPLPTVHDIDSPRTTKEATMNLQLGTRLAALATAALLTLVMLVGVNSLATQPAASDLMVQATTSAAQG
jgi:hypothetical protein